MPITGFFLRNRRFSLVAFIFLLALGAGAMRSIPVSEDPSLEIPRYDVVAVAPGMDPVDLERQIVVPLEDALKELDDVKRTTAMIRDGVTQLTIEFQFGSDTEKKYADVLRTVDSARQRLPSSLARLEVLRGLTTNVAIMQMALVSNGRPYLSLQAIAEDLRRNVAAVDGVKKAEIHALPEKEIHVTLKPSELERQGIPLQRVLMTVQGSLSDIPGGRAVLGDHRVNVVTTGAASDLGALRDLPLIPSVNGAGTVQLRDVAAVDWSFDEKVLSGRFNGDRAVFLTVMMQKGRNIYEVSEGIRNCLELFKKQLPADTRLEVGFDQSKNVRNRMSQLEHDFVLALLLVLITLAPLGFRPALIVMISIPLCLALGLAVLQWSDFGLNQLSTVGCVIALGLLVDDSIVVVENIARFLREGHSRAEAARLATRQITAAVLGTTATMLLAFLPLLMLPEAAGLFIRSLPAAVVFAIIASLFVALTIVPWLASMILTAHDKPKVNPALRLLQWSITSFYLPILRWCMKHRWAALLMVGALTAGSFALIPSIGFSLFPKADTPQFLVQITADEGTGAEATNRIVERVEQLLMRQREVKDIFTTLGEGNPRVYYNVFPSVRKTGTAAILVSLVSYKNEQTPIFIEKLRLRARQIPGARIEFREFQNGPPLTAPIEVRVMGEDLPTLARIATEVAAQVAATPGTRDVTNPSNESRTVIAARLNEDWIAQQGIDRVSAQQAVRLAFAGLEAGTLREENGDTSTIRLCLPPNKQAGLTDWDEIPIPLTPAHHLTLSQIAQLDRSTTIALVERRNGVHVATVASQVQSGFNIAKVASAVRERLQALKLPPGFRWEFGGEEEGRIESFAGFGNAILLSVFGIVGILVLEFKTFRGTLIVASVIPLGIIGGLVGLFLAGYSLSFMAMVGFIALTGVEIKNSILLVDFTNQLRAKGMPLDEAIARAGEVRFLPVVLTTLTALGALVPLALQRSALYSPLAVVIMGGSLSSLLLSRLVTPVLYRILPPKIGEP